MAAHSFTQMDLEMAAHLQDRLTKLDEFMELLQEMKRKPKSIS